MKINRLKMGLASVVTFIALLTSTQILNAQQANWCRWDDNLMVCKPTAPDGYCAVSGPNCDVPVVINNYSSFPLRFRRGIFLI